MSVTFTWEPDPAQLGASMEAVADSLYARVVPLEAASEAMQADIRERFETGTDPEGNPWKDWAPSYQPYAAEHNTSILRQTDELMEAAASSEAQIVTNDTVFYQTGMLPHYGLAHESGLEERKNPLPQRSFLGLSEQSVAIIYGFFSEWFDASISLYPTKTGKLGRRHAFRAIPGGFFISAK